MLTLEDLIVIYDAGFDIETEDHDDNSLIYGHCIFSEKRVVLYIESIGDSIQELYKTIIHEFIHARDYLLETITDEFIESNDEKSKERFRQYEQKVEDETELTYINSPEIALKIFECWGLTQYINKVA